MNSQNSVSRSRGIKIRRFTVEQMVLAKNLYENDKNAGISSDQHPNAYTTQAMFDQILKYMKITK